MCEETVSKARARGSSWDMEADHHSGRKRRLGSSPERSAGLGNLSVGGKNGEESKLKTIDSGGRRVRKIWNANSVYLVFEVDGLTPVLVAPSMVANLIKVEVTLWTSKGEKVTIWTNESMNATGPHKLRTSGPRIRARQYPTKGSSCLEGRVRVIGCAKPHRIWDNSQTHGCKKAEDSFRCAVRGPTLEDTWHSHTVPRRTTDPRSTGTAFELVNRLIEGFRADRVTCEMPWSPLQRCDPDQRKSGTSGDRETSCLFVIERTVRRSCIVELAGNQVKTVDFDGSEYSHGSKMWSRRNGRGMGERRRLGDDHDSRIGSTTPLEKMVASEPVGTVRRSGHPGVVQAGILARMTAA
ncbi:hypothetical protein EDB83DRAFT_2321473 [Lactarius deliciosus]|nr:hypothetical protein EDB83DRAFT_2321473 [Lactarius deliciosus]